MNSKNKGFTLIELLVVVLIIGVLAAIAVPQYQKAVLKSRFSSLMPSTRAVRDGNELYYMTQNRYASNMSDLDVKVASNDESTIQVKNDGDYIYTIATAPKLKNNLVMYQKHSGKFAGEIHCEADKDDAQAIWLCSQGLHGVEKDGSLTPNYKTYILEGAGTDSFGAAGKTITGFLRGSGDASQCTDEMCELLVTIGGVLQYSDGSIRYFKPYLDYASQKLVAEAVFYDPNSGEMRFDYFVEDGDLYSVNTTYDNNKTASENVGYLSGLLNAEKSAGNKTEGQYFKTLYPDETDYLRPYYEEQWGDLVFLN